MVKVIHSNDICLQSAISALTPQIFNRPPFEFTTPLCVTFSTFGNLSSTHADWIATGNAQSVSPSLFSEISNIMAIIFKFLCTILNFHHTPSNDRLHDLAQASLTVALARFSPAERYFCASP